MTIIKLTLALFMFVLSQALTIERREHHPSNDSSNIGDTMLKFEVPNLHLFNTVSNDSILDQRARGLLLRSLELGTFVGRLKLFVHETGLDIVTFEERLNVLNSTFSNITASKLLGDSPQDLMDQLSFAEVVFSAMLEANKQWNLQEKSGLAAHRLIYKLLELRVRAFSLLDTYGNLDLHVDGYIGEIKRLESSFRFWSGKFRQLTRVSSADSSKFEIAFARVEETLQLMISQIPRSLMSFP